MMRMPLKLLATVLACLAAGSAEAKTHVKLDVDLRHGRPKITRFRSVRRFGWHSGTHYGPYVDGRGRWRVGWHTGTHQDWYTIDIPVLDKFDKGDWEVFVRLGRGKTLRVRGDVNRKVQTTTTVVAPRGQVLRWLRPDGSVIIRGPHSRKKFIGNGWEGFDLGDSIIMVDLPGSPGVEVYLKQKTKDLAAAKKSEQPADAEKLLERRRLDAKRDKLLDLGDEKFALGLYPQAALLYQKAMKLDKTDAIARFAVAHSLFALGAYKTAGKNVRLALDKFPDWGLVALDLPKFYKGKATFFNKLVQLKRYVLDHPDDEDAGLLLAYCQYFSGNRKDALARFEKLAKRPAGDKHAQLFIDLATYEPDGREPRKEE